MSVEDLYLVLLLGTTVLLVAVGAVRLSTRAGLPSLLVYLGLGLLLGESGPGGLDFDDAALARVLGLTALAVILAEGGLTTRWQAVRPAAGLATVLATVGVGVSVAVTAVAARLVLDVEWRTAVLLGAVVSSTDAAAVFATLRRLRLPSRVVGALELESGINDAPAVLLVSLLSAPSFGDEPAWQSALLLAYELVAGGAVGVAAGVAGTWLLRRSALPAAGLYPLGVVGCSLFAFALAGVAHASGFLAVYLAALVLGNASLPHRQATLGFAEGLAWLAQIGLFVMLGLLASPSRLSRELLPALAIGAVLLLLARPLSVAVSAAPFRLPWREQAFLSWAGLRGAVPIVLATIPVTEGVAGGTRVFDLVFVLVVVFTLVQGTTLAPVARVLRVVRPGEARELPMDAAPLEDLHADLLQVRVPPGSRLHGTYLGELRLPPGAMVSLVVRDGASFVPDGATRLRTDDDLLVVTTSASRVAAERRLRAVSRRGRLARWYGEDGRELPDR